MEIKTRKQLLKESLTSLDKKIIEARIQRGVKNSLSDVLTPLLEKISEKDISKTEMKQEMKMVENVVKEIPPTIDMNVIQMIVNNILQNVKGEKGDKGDQGEKGDIGEMGAVGPKGDQGIAGAQGSQGPKGERGNDGKKGTNGQDGKKGECGPAGKDGKDGIHGQNGSPDTAMDIVKKINGLPLNSESMIDASHIKNLSSPIMGSGGKRIKGRQVRDDLSSQCDGSQKTFTLTKKFISGTVQLFSTQFPIIYRPDVDFTEDSAGTLTLTSEVGAPALGQTLVALYEKYI